VDASLPYFLPAPFLLTARSARSSASDSRFPTSASCSTSASRADCRVPRGAAGAVARRELSRVVRIPPGFQGLELGEPLCSKG
jgi:hypothetical protein